MSLWLALFPSTLTLPAKLPLGWIVVDMTTSSPSAGRLCCLRQAHAQILYKEPIRRSAVSRLEGSRFAVSGFAVRCLWAK